MQFATIAAGMAIFIAPFRASAGLRGAMLLLAGAAILVAHYRSGQLKQLVPAEKLLGAAFAAWLISTSIWSVLGPAPLESLSVVKRDVLTTALAFLVFHALTRTRADIMRWIKILIVGLVILTGMVIIEPIVPRAYGPARAYVDVGWLTTWLVTVAPLLVWLMMPPRRQHHSAKIFLLIALTCLLWSAWLSGNRAVWVCYAAIVVVSASIAGGGGRTAPGRMQSYLLSAGLLVLIGLFMAASMKFRAEAEAAGNAGQVAFVLQDGRAQIWRVAWEMFRERPLLGFGYNNPDFPEVFAAHFEPGWRHLFRHGHNVVLNHMLQMGVTGAAVIVFLFAALVGAFVRCVRAGPLARVAGICGIAMIIGVFLRNSTDDFFSRHALQFFGAFAGMLMGLATRRPPLTAVNNSLPLK